MQKIQNQSLAAINNNTHYENCSFSLEEKRIYSVKNCSFYNCNFTSLDLHFLLYEECCLIDCDFAGEVSIMLRNDVEQIPQWLFSIKVLVCLNLSLNQIKTLPSNIEQLPNLLELNLSWNPIASLPIENLSQLKKLYLSGITYNDNIIQQITHLKELSVLVLSKNNLDDLPRELHLLPNLTELDISGNNLETYTTALKSSYKKSQLIFVPRVQSSAIFSNSLPATNSRIYFFPASVSSRCSFPPWFLIVP